MHVVPSGRSGGTAEIEVESERQGPETSEASSAAGSADTETEFLPGGESCREEAESAMSDRHSVMTIEDDESGDRSDDDRPVAELSDFKVVTQNVGSALRYVGVLGQIDAHVLANQETRLSDAAARHLKKLMAREGWRVVTGIPAPMGYRSNSTAEPTARKLSQCDPN